MSGERLSEACFESLKSWPCIAVLQGSAHFPIIYLIFVWRIQLFSVRGQNFSVDQVHECFYEYTTPDFKLLNHVVYFKFSLILTIYLVLCSGTLQQYNILTYIKLYIIKFVQIMKKKYVFFEIQFNMCMHTLESNYRAKNH